MKQCKKCQEEKPLSDFYRRSESKDGRTSKCKECIRVERDSDEYRQKRREREAKNKDHRRKVEKEWREKNKEKVAESTSRYYEKNREKKIAQVRAWQDANYEHFRAYRSAYRINQRAEEWGLPGRITGEDLLAKEAEQDKCCARCGDEFIMGDLEKRPNCDHIITMGLGGPNEPSNLQYLCESCHDTKTAEDRNAIRRARKNAAM